MYIKRFLCLAEKRFRVNFMILRVLIFKFSIAAYLFCNLAADCSEIGQQDSQSQNQEGFRLLKEFFVQGLDKSNANPQESVLREVRYQTFAEILEKSFVTRYGSELTQTVIKSMIQPESPHYKEILAYAAGEMPFTNERQYFLKKAIEKEYIKEVSEHFRRQFLEHVNKLDPGILKAEFLELDQAAEKINDPKAKRSLYFEFYRTLAFYDAMPGFHQEAYLIKKLSMLRLGTKAVSLCDLRGKEFLPRLPTDSSTCFLFDGMNENWSKANPTWRESSASFFPFGVLKSGREWEEEKAAWKITNKFLGRQDPFVSSSMMDLNGRQFVWETAMLFGFDQSFMPTQMLEVYGTKHSLQPYWQYFEFPFPIGKSADASDIFINQASRIASKPFYACCLGSLLLSVYDQSFENSRFRQLEDGSLSILNFDDGTAFPVENGFFPNFLNQAKGQEKELNSFSRSFWAWYFDLPQAKTLLQGTDLMFVQNLVGAWNERFADFTIYMNHPLNNFDLGDMDKRLNAFKERLDVIRQMTLDPKEKISMLNVLYKMIPAYRTLVENLQGKISMAGQAPLCVIGFPNNSMNGLENWLCDELGVPKNQAEDFLNWYQEFALQINKSGAGSHKVN